MASKYDGLRRELETACADEMVSLTFDELDNLVGGLPPSARIYRPWWANTAIHNRPQAMAWLGSGRKVIEVRMDQAVVFSPADQEIDQIGQISKQRAMALILNGVDALSTVLDRAGYSTIANAVAAHTVFLHPDTVVQTEGHALFRLVRDPTRRGMIDLLPDGNRVMFDDNQGPTLAYLWSSGRKKGPDVQFNHVWGDPRNVDTYTALWNLCVTPAFLSKTTDGSNHPEVLNLLRFRSFDLFGFLPNGEIAPERPSGYETLVWPEPPALVRDLESLLIRRLAGAPRSRPATSAKKLGWLYGPPETNPF